MFLWTQKIKQLSEIYHKLTSVSPELSYKRKFCNIFSVFGEKIWYKFWISLSVLYILVPPIQGSYRREKTKFPDISLTFP